MKKILLAVFLIAGLISSDLCAQIFTRPVPGKENADTKDLIHRDAKRIPDADRDDIPFIDYKKAVIYTNPKDTLCADACIRKNFTDQLLSVWSPPGRYFPASGIFGVSLDGNYYRSMKLSPGNYVFAQKMVEGEMDLYMYRIIPQTNGWVEMVSNDPEKPGYTNHMIIEEKGRRGKWERYGYFISSPSDSNQLIRVSSDKIQHFADAYLTGSPLAYAEAMKYSETKSIRSRKVMVLGVMTAGIVGAVFIGPEALWLFAAGFPLAGAVALANKPQALHWEDMVRIVSLYNQEQQAKTLQP